MKRKIYERLLRWKREDAILFDALEINKGMLTENVVAQMLTAAEAHISIDNPDAGLDIPCNFDAGDELDLKWRLARHAAAVEHALTKTALSQQSKDIYRAYVLDEEPLKTVAKRFGVSENTVAQTKTRVNKMIAALEEGMAW